MAETTYTVKFEGKNQWLELDLPNERLHVHVDLTLPAYLGGGTRHARLTHGIVVPEALEKWKGLVEQHPDLVQPFFFTQGPGLGGGPLVAVPLGLHVQEISDYFAGKTVMLDFVLYPCRGVWVPTIGGNPLWERQLVTLKLGPRLEDQPFPTPEPVVPPMKVTMWKAEPGQGASAEGYTVTSSSVEEAVPPEEGPF